MSKRKPYKLKILLNSPALATDHKKLHKDTNIYQRAMVVAKLLLVFLVIMFILYATGFLFKMGSIGFILINVAGIVMSFTLVAFLFALVYKLKINHCKDQISKLYQSENLAQYDPYRLRK